MGSFEFDVLKKLARPRENIGISIILPYLDTMTGSLKNPSELKNLLQKVKNKMVTYGIKEKEIDKLLLPGHQLVDDDSYWRDKYGTLAIFIFLNEFYAYKLEEVEKEITSISRYPFVKPIFKEVMTNRKMLVLLLDAGGSRLFRFDKNTYADITPKNIKKSSKDYAGYFQIERETNYHIGRRGGGERSKEGIISHGHDNTSQLDKRRAAEYVHMVVKEVKKIVDRENLELILAGNKDGSLRSVFEVAFGNTLFIPSYIQIETVPLDIEKLQERVHEVIEGLEKTAEKINSESISNLLGTGLSSIDSEEIIRAAHHGRVNTLFVNDQSDIFGTATKYNDDYEVKITNDPEDEELTNVAIIESWRQGAKIIFVDGAVIGDRPMMAEMRY